MSLPAHPWTVAVYLRWVERKKNFAAAKDALAAISRQHLLKTARVPERHPTVQRTMAALELRDEAKASHADLFDDSAILDASQPPPEDIEDVQEKPGRRTLRQAPKLVRKRPR